MGPNPRQFDKWNNKVFIKQGGVGKIMELPYHLFS